MWKTINEYKTKEGYLAVITQASESVGAFLCGYIGIPKGHSLYEAQGSDDLEVHGGVTFCGAIDSYPDYWFFGFDCAHACDLPRFGGIYKDEPYVKTELEHLSEQISLYL